MTDNREFDGKVAVVIGGVTGIGAATVELLARSGARVAIAGPQDIDVTRSLCDEITARGQYAVPFVCDITQRASIDILFADVREQLGPVDIVVNSAGVFQQTPVFETDPAVTTKIIAVNLVGCINVIHAAVTAMSDRGGAIVCVSSTQSKLAEPGCGVYAASKAGLSHFVASLAPDLKGSGIRVNCVAPGAVRTPMVAPVAFPETPEMEAFLDCLNQNSRSPYEGFFMDPEEIARTIAFLASDAARPIHATTIMADQGHSSALPEMTNVRLGI